MYQTYDFAIVGGDKRQIYMAKNIIKSGYSVITYGLNLSDTDISDIPISDSKRSDIGILGTSLDCLSARELTVRDLTAKSLANAIDSSKVILTPIPLSKDKKTIVSVTKEEDLTISNLMDLLNSNHILYGGCLSKELMRHCDSLGIYYEDFMEQEDITLYNTIATAEGTLAEAILHSPINLHQSSCLILGYGRCAKTLADKLKYLCGSVTIAARSNLALSEANTSSFKVLPLDKLEEQISEYQFIFNTIPALVITENLLASTLKDVLIIDIASAPGGVDFPAAQRLNRNAKLCLGLPGKYAPEASADYLTSYLLTSLGKK
ncbi:MAG: dipicolinate synthase subunit DpsA [Anaerocolumna sp.]